MESNKRANQNEGSPPKKAKYTPLAKYELAYVVNKAHKQQVLDQVNIRKVSDDAIGYEHVRRNKKFIKIQEMKASKTGNLKEIVSTKKPLDLLSIKFHGSGIYSSEVIEILKHAEKFHFQKDGDVWKINDSGKEILSTDFSQEDLTRMKPELENDLGALKSATEYICTQVKGDVVVLNSHPGHHAGSNKVANYCVINNAIVSAAMIKKEKPNANIAILDLDAHPGDGTQQLVQKNKSLIARYISLHGEDDFENMETFKKKENAVVMRGKISWKTYDQKLQATLKTLQKSNIDILLVCIGFDTLKEDPNGGKRIGFQLLPLHFRKIGALLATQNAKVAFLQEGGYDCNLCAEAFQHLLEGFEIGRKIHAINQI